MTEPFDNAPMASIPNGLNAVLRISDVMLSRASLEATAGPLTRFEASQPDGTSYAQINAPEDCDWADVIVLLKRVGPALLDHATRKEIGRPSLDVGFFMSGSRVSASLVVPTEVLTALGQFGFDLEASAYLSD